MQADSLPTELLGKPINQCRDLSKEEALTAVQASYGNKGAIPGIHRIKRKGDIYRVTFGKSMYFRFLNYLFN